MGAAFLHYGYFSTAAMVLESLLSFKQPRLFIVLPIQFGAWLIKEVQSQEIPTSVVSSFRMWYGWVKVQIKTFTAGADRLLT